MTTIAEAAQQLEDAVRSQLGDRVRVYRIGSSVQPPAVVLSLPSLGFQAYCGGPTHAQFPVWLVVPFDERASDRLWELVPLVAAAVETVPDAALARGETAHQPGAFPSEGKDLPAHRLLVDFAL